MVALIITPDKLKFLGLFSALVVQGVIAKSVRTVFLPFLPLLPVWVGAQRQLHPIVARYIVINIHKSPISTLMLKRNNFFCLKFDPNVDGRRGTSYCPLSQSQSDGRASLNALPYASRQ